jgi:hypothetical protein
MGCAGGAAADAGMDGSSVLDLADAGSAAALTPATDPLAGLDAALIQALQTDVYLPLHTAAENFITSPTGEAIDNLINQPFVLLFGRDLIGNGLNDFTAANTSLLGSSGTSATSATADSCSATAAPAGPAVSAATPTTTSFPVATVAPKATAAPAVPVTRSLVTLAPRARPARLPGSATLPATPAVLTALAAGAHNSLSGSGFGTVTKSADGSGVTTPNCGNRPARRPQRPRRDQLTTTASFSSAKVEHHFCSSVYRRGHTGRSARDSASADGNCAPRPYDYQPVGSTGCDDGKAWRRRCLVFYLGVPGRYRQPQHVGAGSGVAGGHRVDQAADLPGQHRLG